MIFLEHILLWLNTGVPNKAFFKTTILKGMPVYLKLKFMKHIAILFLLMTSGVKSFAQDTHQSFEPGEWFKFRIHYGMFTASYATLEVREDSYRGRSVHHIVGQGKSSGFLSFFFKVDDKYESYIDTETVKPYRFLRNINEGGYTKNIEINFDQETGKATVEDKKHKTTEIFPTNGIVQDMMSAFYYLRNSIDSDKLKEGDETIVNMFFDKENYKFKLRFLGKEVIRTKMGKVRCMKFRPYVMADRIFKEEESMTVWVSDDDNRMPIKVKAEILVGSIEADLEAFKGLKHPFKVVVD